MNGTLHAWYSYESPHYTVSDLRAWQVLRADSLVAGIFVAENSVRFMGIGELLPT